MSLTGQYILID